jgi:broad specificity phosphatase PhoE
MANRIRKYYIFRHGETFVTKGWKMGYGTKIFSADILEDSRPALEKIGRYLRKIPTDVNTSSKIKRCRQTVKIVSKNSKKDFVFDSRLNEFFFELPFFFRKRIKSFLNDLGDSDSVLICTHAAVINELIKIINPQAFESLEKKTPTEVNAPLQVEVSRKDLQLQNKLTFTKYLAPGVLLILMENSVREINFNTKPGAS